MINLAIFGRPCAMCMSQQPKARKQTFCSLLSSAVSHMFLRIVRAFALYTQTQTELNKWCNKSSQYKPSNRTNSFSWSNTSDFDLKLVHIMFLSWFWLKISFLLKPYYEVCSHHISWMCRGTCINKGESNKSRFML